MNVTIYCCKRRVKHRIKDVLHSTQSITVDEMETDLNTYSFLTCLKKKGREGKIQKTGDVVPFSQYKSKAQLPRRAMKRIMPVVVLEDLDEYLEWLG